MRGRLRLTDHVDLDRTIHNPQADQAHVGPSAAPDSLTVLGSAAGNQAVGRLIQTKLTVGAAGDRYEREADVVAKQVMGSLSAAPQPAAPAAAQRQPEEEELMMSRVRRQPEEEELMMSRVRRQPEEEELMMSRVRRQPEEEELMMSRIQRAPVVGLEGGPLDSSTESLIQGAKSGGQSLDAGVQREMEGAFGADFSGVKVHTGGQADSLNDSLQARAFTTGSDVFIRGEDYHPDSSAGKELLAHELTHVVQQGGG